VVISEKSGCRKSHHIKIDNSALECAEQLRYLGMNLACQKILFRKKLRAD
jgi:hypothetical protein